MTTTRLLAVLLASLLAAMPAVAQIQGTLLSGNWLNFEDVTDSGVECDFVNKGPDQTRAIKWFPVRPALQVTPTKDVWNISSGDRGQVTLWVDNHPPLVRQSRGTLQMIVTGTVAKSFFEKLESGATANFSFSGTEPNWKIDLAGFEAAFVEMLRCSNRHKP